MGSESKFHEGFLYEVWQKLDHNTILETINGEEIAVLDCGALNHDSAGPDFKNARIRIGNLTYVGDIEIDYDYSDWKLHGHNIDNKYNSVILHVTFENKNNHGYVYTRSGRKIPSITIASLINSDEIKKIKETHPEEKNDISGILKCSAVAENAPVELRNSHLYKLGIERFNKKCNKIYERLKEIQFLKDAGIKEPVVSYDLTEEFQKREFHHKDFHSKEVWMQLLYELLFEALGYSKNKNPMTSLARKADIEFLKKIEKDGVILQKFESALLHISGLADSLQKEPDIDTKEYLEKSELYWNSIKPFYDGDYLESAQWQFFRIRPQNFPTVRIAGGARILYQLLHNDLIGVITKKIKEIRNLGVLVNSVRSLFVIKSDGYWKSHYVLGERASTDIKYFVGASRADEIMINVILPYFAVYFKIYGHEQLTDKIVKTYGVYEQRAENQIIHNVADALGVQNKVKKTVYAQGMIDLFRNYCSKNKCLECEIGKVVFE
ncbi:DUF2851 family protein [Melioribacter sp. Ez-97]|uniref:DUF2851 family protein n=1 Tax=Melioribacter sp. Ez-97 TaxID=3423434 RepID=UPI003ED9FCBB